MATVFADAALRRVYRNWRESLDVSIRSRHPAFCIAAHSDVARLYLKIYFLEVIDRPTIPDRGGGDRSSMNRISQRGQWWTMIPKQAQQPGRAFPRPLSRAT